MVSSSSKVRIVTLGCAKNEVDSEEIAGVLLGAGYDVDGAAKKTALTIINTCGFLESAKDESVKAIKEAVREKRAGRTGKVIVAGCLAQRLGPELQRLAPGADLYIGVGQMARFAEIALEVQQAREANVEVTAPHHRWADVQTRARSGRPWSAYLKISEGCDHKCTFCTIPSFRGGHQSKPIERVLAEAQHLARTGAQEINLIAQDVTQYGFDLYREFTLPKLLRELNAVDGIKWIRLLYFYPNRLTDEVIETMSSCEKVLPYIDIPLQHTHPDTLRRMHRPWDGERYLRLFEKVRAAMPQCAIRTTFIVGFPGETDAEFQHMIDFTRDARLDRVGAFMFSKEPGTPAHDLENQVAPRIKQERYDRLMRLQQGISLEKNEAWIGRDLQVLIEDKRDGWLIGRSHRDAPEIDGLVFVQGEAEPGSIVTARVNGAEHYDLYAEMTRIPVSAARTMTPLRMAGPAKPL
ncbi:MiaB-like tRNA modifying enzyme YliG [Fimbriimonas ginsengisoli Gsoil 348]|uniref:Ribosomal protein uS12 methylthiotransferase RimO n=1 Tax=Fimbriimonas ginsengisoli Gsoil 348 TaxID=661478 RepID=A0A068NTC2_FIMGI|nr:MiaB-like tRNA modifying enzyme YliG [Fimbriimonas ginsengisoli Gsoil 348]